jgi:2-aminoadipate transaminase
MTNAFDFTPLLRSGLPPAAAKFGGLPKYNFTGGNNDADELPLDGLISAANSVLTREGRNLSTYNLAGGPQGYLPLREFLAKKLNRDAGMNCSADNILLVSGSLQALDLINGIFLEPGDTVIVERDNYQGTLNRLTRSKVNTIGIPLDSDGMRMDALAQTLADLKTRGVRPKFI